MRKLFIILVAFIAVVTFIRAFDTAGSINLDNPTPIAEKASEITIN